MDTNLYDLVQYPSQGLAQAHPDRLATLALLFGLRSPNVESCRVLEIGCGDGINLLSVAQGLPQATCVGIDLAASGIEKGQEVIDYLELKNVSLRQFNIMDIEPAFGEFDYIVAHGIYSWIPDFVRDKLLAVCKANLAKNGVAYISYNTYPGNHIRNLVRGMMKFHVAEMPEPAQKIAQSRGLLKFLAGAGTEDPGFYRGVLGRELERLNNIPDSVVYHDDLSEVNHPVHFYEFAEHARKHGLQYLSEAQFFEIQSGVFPKETMDIVNEIADSRVAKEQYLDFLKCRSFRQTLLVHTEQQLDFAMDARRISQFHVASPANSEAIVSEAAPGEKITFQGPQKSALTTDNSVVQCAFDHLGRMWPRTVHFSDLFEYAYSASARKSAVANIARGDAERELAETLLRTYAAGMIELSVCPPRLAALPGEFPVASPLARLQAAAGGAVINLRHHNIRIDDMMGRGLVTLLDGTRDRVKLKEDLAELMSTSLEEARREGASPATMEELQCTIEGELEKSLMGLARMALLAA